MTAKPTSAAALAIRIVRREPGCVAAPGAPCSEKANPRVIAMLIFSTLAAVVGRWRRRARQRAELTRLATMGFDFKDIGLDLGAVAVETTRWPWQRIRLVSGSVPPRSPACGLGLDLQQAATHGGGEQHHQAAQLR